MDTMQGLYEMIMTRKTELIENSYTCYLFEQGIDKILKKVGEECSEVIIAAKNGTNESTAEEISDLIYHIMVLMAQQNIEWEMVADILEERRKKQSNLKKMKITDKNT